MARPKKKVVKKKVVKRAPAKRVVKKAPKPPDHDLTPNANNVIMNRMLDVVEANTVQVKTLLVLVSQLSSVIVESLNLMAEIKTVDTTTEAPTEKKPNKRRQNKKAETKAAEQPPEQPPEQPTELEEKRVVTMNMLTTGFEKMKGFIGETEAHKYLRGYNGCKDIATLDEKYWISFIEIAPTYCKEILESQKNGNSAPPKEVEITLPDLRAALNKVDKAHGRDKAREILHYYFPRDAEAKTVGQLDKKDYADLVERCEKACAA